MTPTPHDALFKTVFSDPPRAAELLQDLLGPQVAARIDWSSLAVEDTSFIDDDLRETHADLLYTARFAGRPCKIHTVFTLLEHMSTSEWSMALRLLRYKLRIWDAHLAADPDARSLPAVFSCVVHHSDRGWRAATTFEALVDLPADAGADAWSMVPRFRYALDDLGAAGVDALQARALSAFVRLTLCVLLEGRSNRQIQPLLAGWSELLREAARDPHGPGAFRPIFRYLAQVRDAGDHTAILTTAREVINPREDKMYTIADMLMDQGREQGVREGLVRALKLLLGDLSPNNQTRLDQADVTTLERWTRLARTAESFDELLGR